MYTLRCVSCLLCFFMTQKGPPDQPASETEVAKQLQAYYRQGDKALNWREEIKNLSKPAAESTRAGNYLRDLVDQALKDELSGAARWYATPAWGSSGKNDARELRKWIARELAAAPASPAVLPAATWYLEKERISEFQADAVKAVVRIPGEEADALLLELAARPHVNAVVAAAALQEVGRRKLAMKTDRMAELCRHYRKSIRDAAREANDKLGNPMPLAFDAKMAVQKEPFPELMRELDKFILEPAPVGAAFVVVTSIQRDKDGVEKAHYEERGWVLSRKGDLLAIQTLQGWRQTHELTDKPKAIHIGDLDFGDTWHVTAKIIPIKEEVWRVAALRAKGDKEFRLSERGGLTGQFQGSGAGLPEAILAHWLFRAKKFEEAATILLPALDTLYTDRHFVEMVKYRLGEVYGKQMLAAFCGNRNYDKTLQLAKRLAEGFVETRFHAYAVSLARQIPLRRDDFKGFRLPTAKEWDEQKKRLLRTQQIDFLCLRLRLLNCFQNMQPGGVSYEQKQFAEPGGMSPDASWGGGEGKTEVINPFVELAGARFDDDDASKPALKGLNLVVADMPQLTRQLREDWFMPTVSYWRDFHPDRELRRTRPLMVRIINAIARQDICSAPELDAMSDAEREKEIARLNQWAKDNAKQSEKPK